MPDIGSIPGITAAETAALARATLFTTSDLLRANRAAVLRREPAITPDRLRAWQGFAALCEIRDITPADAARLQAAGFGSPDEVAGADLARLRAALAGTADDTILSWVKDAVCLGHTGVINGTVTLRDGRPVEGAAVFAGGTAATTDARGRFRVIRLPLDRPAIGAIHHPALGARLAPKVPVLRTGALEGQSFVLPGRPQPPVALSERLGDRLPPLGGSTMTTRTEPGSPAPDDILMVISRHPGGDARAVSRFLDFAEGRFVRRIYRIPAAALPAGLQDGDDIEWTGSLWALARYSAREIARKTRLRGVRRRYPNPARNAEDMRRQVRAYLRAASDPKENRR